MPQANQTVSVQHPEGFRTIIHIGDEYAASSPLVKAYPWAFGEKSERAVEAATAAPGEKRRTAPRKKKAAAKPVAE